MSEGPLKILHVVPYYRPALRYGGPVISVHGLSRALALLGHDVHVYTTSVDGPVDSPVPLAAPVNIDGVQVRYFRSRRVRRLYWAPDMAIALAENIRDFEVAHLHTLFQWPTTAAARIAQSAAIPYVVAPRGMLEKGLFRRRSRMVKSAWIALFEQRTLERASAIHATSEREVAEAKAFGFQLPRVFVVPNGVDIESDESGAVNPVIGRIISERPYLLFLGRINWKKGLDRLIESLQHLPATRLVVAGGDEDNYRTVLQTLAVRRGVGGQIMFTGPAYGADKSALLHHAAALVLPSYSENFGNVVLEAMAAGCPVVTTPEVGAAAIVQETGSGIVSDGTAVHLADTIRALLASQFLRNEMGRRGREAVKAKYSWPKVAEQMLNVYRHLRTGL